MIPVVHKKTSGATAALFFHLLVVLGVATTASTSRRAAFAEEPERIETTGPTKHLSPVDLFSTIAPAVVKLVVRGEGGGILSTGSGFVLSVPSSTTCDVVTNYHVIRAAVDVDVEFHNIEFHDGYVAHVREVLREDPVLDLALLRVELPEPRESLACATLDIRTGAQPPIGTRLYAIGSPKGMKNTLSDGLLSGYRSLGLEATWVQITNPISPGSSGGPVFTDAGAFVGITTAFLPDAQNLNFAISAKKVQEFSAREDTPRPQWKGSCIGCEETEVLFRFYKEVYERFRKQDADPNLRAPSDWGDMLLWAVGIVSLPREQRFLDFCTAEARAGNLGALVLVGCFKLGQASPGEPDRMARSNEAIALLKQALPLAGDDQFFILYNIAKAQNSLFGALDTPDALPNDVRERFLDETVRNFEAARDLRPRFTPTLRALGETLYGRGRVADALQVSTQLANLVPNSPKVHIQRAETLRSLGSRLAAIDELRAAWDLDPYSEWIAMKLGDLYVETGQQEKAIDAYRGGLNAGSRFAAGLPDVYKNSPEMVGFEKVLSGGVLTWQLQVSIARSFVALKRYDEALDAFRRALDAAGDGASPENRQMLERELAACRAMSAQPR